jgi:hypothetical protein
LDSLSHHCNADHQQLTTPASLSPQEAIQSPSAASNTPHSIMSESLGITTLWNTQGITSETMDFIFEHLPVHTDLFFITETWLRPLRSLPTTWNQIHNLGISVDRASRGQLGISLLTYLSFPFTILPLPIYQESNYILPCLCQNYLIILSTKKCFWCFAKYWFFQCNYVSEHLIYLIY